MSILTRNLLENHVPLLSDRDKCSLKEKNITEPDVFVVLLVLWNSFFSFFF